MTRHILALGMIGFTLLMALAWADGDNEKDAPPLKKIMKAQKKANKAVFQAVKAKKQQALQAAAKALADASKGVADAAPDDVASKEDKEAWAKFAKSLNDNVQKLVDAANKTGGDSYWKNVGDASQAVSDSCKACHDVFNKDDDR